MRRMLAAMAVLGLAACAGTQPTAPPEGTVQFNGLSASKFNEYGYNYTARIFVGTGESWSLAKGLPADYLGVNAPDKLVMKWNAEWDRGNSEGWTNGPYSAWTDNEWNGNCAGCSGQVWHYKIKWYGLCTEGETLPDGGYCIWGQFDVVMDQGRDPAEGHVVLAVARPNGYGH